MEKIDKKNIDYLLVFDIETEFLISDFEKSNEVKALKKREDFEAFLESNFRVKNLIILVELDWNTHVSQFYGYGVAKELMESPNRVGPFNLLFISTLKRETIFQLNTGKNRVFTKRFPHEQITTKLDFKRLDIPEMSKRKFDYLKNYCLIESGIIDRIEHNIRNLSANIDSSKLKEVLQEIEANSEILSEEIVVKTRGIKTDKNLNKEKIKETLKDIHQLLLQLMSEMNNPGNEEEKKSTSVVLLIEDEKETLKKLEKQLGNYFHTVRTFHKGSEAYEELKKNAEEYDVILTDMELLDGDFDDKVQGIDILELCEDEYPFLVTRVITSLPKNALKRLTGKEFDKIIFKSVTSDSIIPPFENLPEFVQKIDKEVKKRRVLRSMKGPKGSWWGKYLTKQLYLTKIKEPDKYEEIWEGARENAEAFIEGKFDNLPEDEKLTCEFKAVDDTSNNPESGWEIIDLLLTHRLIALWFAAKNNWEKFDYDSDSNEAYVHQNGFQKNIKSRSFESYVNSFLGLSRKKNKKGQYKIIPKNLFPEEVKWVDEKQTEAGLINQIRLEEFSYEIESFFTEFFDVYKPGVVSGKTTFGEVLKLTRIFIKEYPNQSFDKEKHNKLKEILTRDAEYIQTLLPQKAQFYLNQITEDIFHMHQ